LKNYLDLAWETNARVDRVEALEALVSARRFLAASAAGPLDPAQWNPLFWEHLCQVSRWPDSLPNYSLKLLLQQCLKMNGVAVSLVEAS
jgi:hypothetical protein